MNERIQQLWEESQSINGSDDGRGGLKILESVEKFAELIVRECIKLCEHESNDDEYDQYDMGMSVQSNNIKTSIKQHFGVEL